MVDIILTAALGGLGDGFLRLALGADEEHAAAAGGDVANGLQRAREERHGLLEIDDVHAVARAEDVILHLRIPAPRVMAEMDAGFQKLAHGKARECHESSSFLRLSRRGGFIALRERHRKAPSALDQTETASPRVG